MKFDVPQAPACLNNYVSVGGTLQAIIIVLFGVFTKYDYDGYNMGQYGMLQDVNVMIFVGFGFLFNLLPKYGWAAVSIVLAIGAMAIPWGIVCFGWIMEGQTAVGSVTVSLGSIANGIFMACSCLIAVATVLGRTSLQQNVILMFCMMPAYAFNQWVVTEIGAKDTGGTILIHCFGAMFGFGVSWMLGHKEEHGMTRRKDFSEEANHNTNLMALLGTLFLWCYYPSFNGWAPELEPQHIASQIGTGLVPWHEDGAKFRATFNTYLGLIGAAVTAILISDSSKAIKKNVMIHMQTGVLAGGVTMGCLCDMYLEPWGALLLGCVGGAVACLGIHFVTPALEKIKVHDTCDCMALHGICAFFSVFASCIAFATPANAHYLQQYGVSAGMQAGKQIAGIFACSAIGIGLALPTGLIMAMFAKDDHWYDQEAHVITHHTDMNSE